MPELKPAPFDVLGALEALEGQFRAEVDKVMVDIVMRDAGYMRFDRVGARHVPFEDIEIRDTRAKSDD